MTITFPEKFQNNCVNNRFENSWTELHKRNRCTNNMNKNVYSESISKKNGNKMENKNVGKITIDNLFFDV